MNHEAMKVTFAESLLHLRQHPAYPVIRSFLVEQLETTRTGLENAPTMEQILFLRGQCGVYRELLNLVDTNLDYLKQINDLDRKHAPEQSVKA